MFEEKGGDGVSFMDEVLTIIINVFIVGLSF